MLSLDDLPEKETILGYLLLDIDQSIFNDAFQAYNWQDAGKLYVLGKDNQVLYASDEAQIASILDENQLSEGKIIAEAIPACNGRILFSLDENQVMAAVRQLRNRLLIFSLVTLSIMLLITWLSSRRMSMPVRRILDQMDQVRMGNLNVSVPVEGEDEMSALSLEFNHMTEALRTHIEQSYIASINKRKRNWTRCGCRSIRIFCTIPWRLSA
jgi:Signal transduction histidine kinase involved in nitrogen fixation and metabolism regulation